MIVDTGVLVAAANQADRHHSACRDLVVGQTRLTIPALVIAEAVFLIERELGPKSEAAFLRSLDSEKYRIESPAEDLARMAELVRQYDDLPLGGTDASVIALAEREGDRQVATLDRRHFAVVKPKGLVFELLPDI